MRESESTEGTRTDFVPKGDSKPALLACQASAVPLGHGSLYGQFLMCKSKCIENSQVYVSLWCVPLSSTLQRAAPLGYQSYSITRRVISYAALSRSAESLRHIEQDYRSMRLNSTLLLPLVEQINPLLL